jgi:hypothetical protein
VIRRQHNLRKAPSLRQDLPVYRERLLQRALKREPLLVSNSATGAETGAECRIGQQLLQTVTQSFSVAAGHDEAGDTLFYRLAYAGNV